MYGTIFPNQRKRKASLGISVNQWACSSVSCEDSILMRGDLYSVRKSFWTTHMCIILEMDACCHSAGSWGGC